MFLLRQTCLVNFIATRHMCRRVSNSLKEKHHSDNLWKTIETSNIKSNQDWKNVRNTILNNSGPRSLINSYNIDALTVGICTSKGEYELAASYLDFLESEQIKPNLATLGKYFRLLYLKNNNNLTAEDEGKILTLYQKIRKVHPVLDATTLSNIIQALSLTTEWRQCIDLLNEIKIAARPSGHAYNAVISTAFLHNEDSIAWDLFSEMLEQDKIVEATTYTSFFKKVFRSTDKFEIIDELEKLFNFLQRHCLKLDAEAVNDLRKLLKKVDVTLNLSKITVKGICKRCQNKLMPLDLSDNEFNELKSKIIKNVIVGKDVFNKTTLDELKRFQNFIENMENFDVVIDGLNVAYSAGVQQSPLVTSGLVASVVSHFTVQKKKVLVLGRNHMNKWPKENWGYILQNATTFLTQNLSQDDPYLLYCALHSGKDTIIITRDLMRGHKFLLKNNHLKLLFDRWLSLRQYHLIRVQDKGCPIFKMPTTYSNLAQKNGRHWHIPCASHAQDNSSTIPWLCIQI